MFHEICFYIHDSTIEVAGKAFPLGELTADILSIRPDEFGVMRELAEQIENGDSTAIGKLHSILMKRKLFQLVVEPDTYGKPEQYAAIVNDIFAFNQTVFWFIDKFLMRLKKLDSENYAAALFAFYTHPGLDKMMVNHYRNDMLTFNLFDTIDVRFAPRELPDKPGEYGICEIYSVRYLQAFLKMDFMKAIMAGHIIRRCRNCCRFFLLTKGYHTEYCDRPLVDNPKRNCRNQGAKNMAKEKVANNPVIHSYTRAYQRVTADKQRGRITAEEWTRVKRVMRDLKDMAISGQYTDRELDDLLQPEVIYTSLKIQRRGGR